MQEGYKLHEVDEFTWDDLDRLEEIYKPKKQYIDEVFPFLFQKGGYCMAGNLGHLAATVGLDINPFLTNERVLKSMIRSTANALRAQDMAFRSSGNNAASALS